jgi:hypothetical protein
MASTFRIKRRAAGGAAGAPTTLLTSEMAYNEADDTLYIGFGDNGSGVATSIKTLAGVGAFLALVGDQTVEGVKTFTASPVFPTPTLGDNTTKAATTAFVTAALGSLSATAWGTITGTITSQTDLVNYIAARVAEVVDSSPGALDTLNELAAALGDDPNFATTITNALATKANLTLSNVTDTAAARTNLGLGSMATQNANAVNITGGSIDGVTISGGTF